MRSPNRDNGRVTEIPGWTHVYSGKVRDLYEPADGANDRMLVVASDRVSAFDYVLSPAIPGKGELLTSLSQWWFDQLDASNHLTGEQVPSEVAGRAMIVQRLDMIPVECVVRGYITGTGWAEYQQSGTVCGIPLPDGLANGDRLPEPIFTPASKAPMGEHDENITFEKTVELVGEARATELRDTSLEIYRRAAEIAEAKGLILADTKFEFGTRPSTGSGTRSTGSGTPSTGSGTSGVLTLADEVLTSDSSRYWDAEAWRTGTTPDERMASFDKQIVRNWLAANWDKQGTPPELPEEIVTRTAARYRELLDLLTA
ncbi:MAG: phosphoribosylaminoimidazolesuccinocarboxamide synthase [Microbacterium sp.]